MGVIIVDNRTIWSECDAEDWSGPEEGTSVTSAPAPVELSGCLGFAVSQEVNYGYYASSAINLEDSIVYHWTTTQGTINKIETGGIQLILGDTTNIIGFHLAGDDVAGFRYNTDVPLWQCLILDTSMIGEFDNVNYFYTEWEGTLVDLKTNLNAITQIGLGFGVASKALGGGLNCYADISRYGIEGLNILGGTTGDRGNMYEVSIADNSRGNQTSYGICRELTTNVYGIQGPLTCGSTGSGSSWFDDDAGSSINYESGLIADDKYYFKVLGSSTFDTHFILDGFTIASAGPKVLVDFSSNNITELSIINSTFKALGESLTFANDASAETHIVSGDSFSDVGIIDPGRTYFQDNNILNTIEPSIYGALLINNDNINTNIANISFTAAPQSDASNHAIYITEPSTYIFTNFSYSGYAVEDGSTGGEVIYNNSGGHVTITLSGGDYPTIQNAIDASTDVLSSIILSLTVKNEAGAFVEGVLAYIDDSSNTAPFIMNTTTNASGYASVAWTGGSVAGAYWRVRKYGYKPFVAISDIATSDKDIPVTLIADPQQS